jgi:hypothetical protein
LGFIAAKNLVAVQGTPNRRPPNADTRWRRGFIPSKGQSAHSVQVDR